MTVYAATDGPEHTEGRRLPAGVVRRLPVRPVRTAAGRRRAAAGRRRRPRTLPGAQSRPSQCCSTTTAHQFS
ncbi:hypothetical protein ACFC1R_35210, partial [Kitasatospora sp. NPDC056138]|uniref:hypothetical protein n=1 Tax=Kitasatospora sp. NPDC056138 TaxID=3345724 RepID=UPI0035D9D7B6